MAEQQLTILWVSNLTDGVKGEEMVTLFEKYGPVHSCVMKGPFSKIEFENSVDAERARHGLDLVDYNGRRLSVDWFRRDPLEAPLEGLNWWGGRPGQPRHFNRVHVIGCTTLTLNHTKLLHLAWKAGSSVVYLDVQPFHPLFYKPTHVHGIIEYAHEKDYRFALEFLDGLNLRIKLSDLLVINSSFLFYFILFYFFFIIKKK